MKFLKGLFTIIAIICIAFTGFFCVSACTGHTGMLDKIERGLSLTGMATGVGTLGADNSRSTISILTEDFGLTTSQAGQVISIASQLGVDTSDPQEVSGFVAKNIGNKSEIQDIAQMYQNGEITESQAKKLLKDIVNV